LLLLKCIGGTGKKEQGRRNREEGTGKKEQGRRNREEGTGKKEQGRRNREEGTGKKEQGRRDREEGTGARHKEQGTRKRGAYRHHLAGVRRALGHFDGSQTAAPEEIPTMSPSFRARSLAMAMASSARDLEHLVQQRHVQDARDEAGPDSLDLVRACRGRREKRRR